MLDLVANQLQELGYRHMAAASLKPKHVEGLVERWQAEGLAVGNIKNRMAELRWWAEKIGKQNVIARDNDHYGIGNRQYVTNVSKARQLTGVELARITDPYTAMSLRLQAGFGVRLGGSSKIRTGRTLSASLQTTDGCRSWMPNPLGLDRIARSTGWQARHAQRRAPAQADAASRSRGY